MRKLLILGAGGHGRVIAEIAKEIGNYSLISFLDDSFSINRRKNFIGSFADVEKFAGAYEDAFVALGNSDLRKQWMVKLYSLGYNLPVLVHPDAYISSSSVIESGSVVMQGAVIQCGAKLGKGCIVSSNAIVDHDATVGEYCHINAGAIIASFCVVPNYTKIDYGELYKF